MKINNIFSTVICILVLSCMLSCSKDDETGGDVDTKTFRVKEITSFYTDNNSETYYDDKSILFYNNERLVEVINSEKENGIWEEEEKVELIYEGDWIVFKSYTNVEGLWVEDVEENMRIKIVNGRIQRVEEFYDSDNIETEYNYSGDKLISIQIFYNDVNELKLDLTYNGDNLQEVVEYYFQDGNWQAVMKFQFSYSEGQLSQIIGSYFNDESWQNSDKYEYIYLIDKLVTIERYLWNDGDWDDYHSRTNFEYNSEGLLVSESETYWDGNSWGQEYLYEEGRGNLKVFWNFMDSMYGINNYPTPQKPADNTKTKRTHYNKSFKGKFLLKRLLN